MLEFKMLEFKMNYISNSPSNYKLITLFLGYVARIYYINTSNKHLKVRKTNMQDFIQPASKKLAFIVDSPQKTLGDVRSALKLIKLIKEKDTTNNDYNIIIRSDEQNWIHIQTIIPKYLTVHFVKYSETEVSAFNEVRDIMENSDLLISYPTPNHLLLEDIHFLKSCKVPLIYGTEYNYNGYKIDGLEDCIGFSTGLGENDLGIYFTEDQNEDSSLDTLTDVSLKSLLLSMADNDAIYHEKYDLFFGYFNQMPLDMQTAFTPTMFLRACLEKANNKKITDIIIPISPKKIIFDSQNDNNSNILDVMKYLLSSFGGEDIFNRNFQISYFKKENDGTFKCINTYGNGDKIIRLINCFPTDPGTIDKLRKASEPFSLATGDQSFSEAISDSKIFIYQTMDWKTNLMSAYINRAKQILPSGSFLLKFLELQEPLPFEVAKHYFGYVKSDYVTVPRIREERYIALLDLLTHHQGDLVQDMKTLSDELRQNCNLNKALPEKIKEILDKIEIFKDKDHPPASPKFRR
jgi:hypothetical protein